MSDTENIMYCMRANSSAECTDKELQIYLKNKLLLTLLKIYAI